MAGAHKQVPDAARPRTMFVTRNGLLEPLGQSQVLGYLRGLSRDFEITLVSCEKPPDWSDTFAMQAMQAECKTLGIRWMPLRFVAHPRYLASAIGALQLLWLIWRESRQGGAGLVHARSYIPAAAAMLAGWLTGVPYLFDMRALWPEELITAGRLRRGGPLHRLIAGLERACLRRAAAVVCLTEAAEGHLRGLYPSELADRPIWVIPTCADLVAFAPSASPPGPPVHGCIGTVLSGWFDIDWFAAWLRIAATRWPDVRFDIATRDCPDRVRMAIDPEGHLDGRLAIAAHRPADMAAVIRKHRCSVLFYADGATSELGRSPTRLAEALGCGVPVVVNAGVGDVAEIVRRHAVGVVVEGRGEAQMGAAMAQLDRLLADPGLALRCRAAAEAGFSLETGVKAFREAYDHILGTLP